MFLFFSDTSNSVRHVRVCIDRIRFSNGDNRMILPIYFKYMLKENIATYDTLSREDNWKLVESHWKEPLWLKIVGLILMKHFLLKIARTKDSFAAVRYAYWVKVFYSLFVKKFTRQWFRNFSVFRARHNHQFLID